MNQITTCNLKRVTLGDKTTKDDQPIRKLSSVSFSSLFWYLQPGTLMF